MLEEIIHVIWHAILDCLKLLPFLFITYILMEYIEHKMTNKSKKAMEKAGILGPVIGGIVGAVPQCGFSVSATNLFSSRVITLGTLISVYLSTSDEMIPVLLSESIAFSVILKLIFIKVFIGMFAGLIIDVVLRKVNKKEENRIAEMCEEESCHCQNGILKSAVKHTISIFIYIFITTMVLNFIIELIGEDRIGNLILNKKIIGALIAGLIGLIPNCASSVIITQLFAKGLISSGALLSGLLVGAGLGILVLFKTNKNLKENIKIIVLLYCIGIVCGIGFELLGIVL